MKAELKKLIEDIQQEIEWLQTTEENEVECISVENLSGILSRFFDEEIKLSID